MKEVPAEEQQHLDSENSAERRGTLNRLLFPKPTEEFLEHRRRFGNTSALDDREFFYGLVEGQETLIRLPHVRTPMVVRLDAISEPDDKGMRNVVTNVNGQIRPMRVRDRSVESVTATAEKADSSNKGHVAAPFAGVVTVTVNVGDEVKAGDPVAIIEAMKMEATITTPVAGVIDRVVVPAATKVEGGDLIVVVS